MKRARTLKVARITPEGSEATLVTFQLQGDDLKKFQFQPGQYLTSSVDIDGAAHWRCYSITTQPSDLPNISVLVKRVANGRVSNWICDNLRPGDPLDVLPPAGRFTLRSRSRTLAMYAGGSGIAPIYALARQALQDQKTRLILFYANRDRAATMLQAEIDSLRERMNGRLDVRYWFDAETGHPTPEHLGELASGLKDGDVYLCGPDAFMQATVAGLHLAGFDSERIYKEDFGAAVADSDDTSADDAGFDGSERTLQVQVSGVRHTVAVKIGQTLLSAMLNAGLQVPHACKVGECASCICRLEEGEVQQMENSVLDDDDVAQGLVLACQSRPISESVRIRFS